MSSAAIKGNVLGGCVREASRRTQIIRHHAGRAAYGPADSAPHRLNQAIEHTQALLDELKSAQLVLGWRDGERTEA